MLTVLGIAPCGVLKAEPAVQVTQTPPSALTVVQAQAPSAKPAAVPTPPAAVSPPAPEKLGGTPAWAAICFSKSRSAAVDCKLEQRLVAKETGRALAVAIVDVPAATRKATLILHMPTGLALQESASLTIDGSNATPLLWQSCDGSGCYATAALTPTLVEAMKKGTSMVVKASFANRDPVVFPFLLTDFSAGYDAVQ
jgi:invasion protein IalB